MATEHRQKIMLGVLAFVLLALVYYQLQPATTATPAPSSNRPADARATRGQQAAPAPGQTAPDVHLGALDAERPKPLGADRNLFRFKPKAPPPPPNLPSRGAEAPAVTAPVVVGPPPPPPLPPIPLKFIGIMGSEHDKIAVLSDGRGAPINGKEGELVLGQYRILKIGVESVELAYADGRGRQTIRLAGQQ